ncbi:MAG: hypothetical protein ABI706_07060 [Ilumatobacteraceae bacterium]
MDHRVEARIAALESELNSLKSLVAGETEAAPPTSDRRGMIKLVAASAVGAVTGAAILSAQPVAAADNDNLRLGVINEATSPTILNTIGKSAFVVNGDGGYGIETDGGLANALFNGTGENPIRSALGAVLGALYVDGAGDWWAATVTDPSNPEWRKLAGPQSAGQLHLLNAPVRVYDSRPGESPTAVGPKAPTASNSPVTIDTRQNSSGVPTTANAVLINLTIAGPQAGGFASVWPSGPFPGTSNINFTPGQNIATSAVVGCGPGASILVMSNTVTDFIIDVSGYYQ